MKITVKDNFAVITKQEKFSQLRHNGNDLFLTKFFYLWFSAVLQKPFICMKT